MISERVSEFRTEYNLLLNTLTNKESELASIHTQIRDRLKLISDNEVALSILKKMLEISNNDTVNVFSKFITTGLRSIFGQDYSIEFVIKDRGNKAKVVEILFKDGEGEAIPIDDAIGGGVQVIIGFLLQVIILKLFNKRMFILLDESLVQVSKQYLPATMKFIKEMSREHGLVTMVITHVDLSDYADVSYEMVNGNIREIYRSSEIEDSDPNIQLVVKDFQNIKDAKIKANGLTIITGPTNNGKSALFRSIIYTLKNQSGTHFINKDADVCKTAISFNNFHGHDDVTVKWTKGKNTKLVIQYRGEEQSFEKLGKGEESVIALYHPCNLDGVKLGDLYITPNWWRQMELPLTTQLDGKTDLFKLFNSMSGTDDLMNAIYKISEDIKVLSNERKELNIKSDVYSVEVGDLKLKVEKMNNTLVEVDAIHSEYKKSETSADVLQFYITVTIESKTSSNELKRIEKLIKSMEELKTIVSNNIQLKDYSNLHNKYNDIRSSIDSTTNTINMLTELIKIGNQVVSIKRYVDASNDCNKKQKFITAFEKIIPLMSNILSTSETISLLTSYTDKSKGINISKKLVSSNEKLIKGMSDIIGQSRTIIELNRFVQIKSTTNDINRIVSIEPHYLELGKLTESIKHLKNHMVILNSIELTESNISEIKKKLAEINVCPLCMQPAHF